jgi:hypothetical protein
LNRDEDIEIPYLLSMKYIVEEEGANKGEDRIVTEWNEVVGNIEN